MFLLPPPSPFQTGDLVKMIPASRSHVTGPYVVQVLFYNPAAVDKGQLKMITYIPNMHSCKMHIGSNWEYHSPRMTVINQNLNFKPLFGR